MMKTLISKCFLALFLSVALMLSITPGAWSAEKTMLKMTGDYPDKHPTVRNGWLPWIDDMKEKSNGQLIIKYFNPNTLAPVRDNFNAVVAGSVDLGVTATWYQTGKFPLTEITALPMLFNGAEAGSLTIQTLYETFPEWRDEYKEVKMLWQWMSASIQLHTTKKEIKTLDDLKGMKIITWGATANRIIRDLGANPIDIVPADTYLALERGMADGVACPLAPMRAFKISDAAKHHTIVDLYNDAFWGGVNWKKWDAMPEDRKKLLEESTGMNMARISGKTLDEGAIEDSQWMKENGHTFYVLPEDEKAKWREKLKGIHQETIKRLEEKGIRNVQAIYDEAMRLAEKFSNETVGGYK
jgi:TRAP-type transport system periplasmic protein